MKEFNSSVSTGNIYSLQRSEAQVRESVRYVVGGNSDVSFLFDSFGFVIGDMNEYIDDSGLLEFGADFLVGSNTMSFFSWEDEFVGGMVVSLPWSDDFGSDLARSFYEGYRSEFGDVIVESFEEHLSISIGDVLDVSAADVGLDEYEVDFIDYEGSVLSVNGRDLYTFGFISDETLNIVYLVSEGRNDSEEKYRDVVRHLDTLSVFDTPKRVSEMDSTAIVSATRALSSPKYQEYIESERNLSYTTQLQFGGDLKIFFDSVLNFNYQSTFGRSAQVTVIGSANATQIEQKLKLLSSNLESIDVSEFSVFRDGQVGERDGNNIFIGIPYLDWACPENSNECPTVITVFSEQEVDQDLLREVNDLLMDVDGFEPYEISVGGNIIE